MTLVGFAWNCGDEGKMMGTFRLGRADFGCFLDLQVGPTLMCYNDDLGGVTGISIHPWPSFGRVRIFMLGVTSHACI